MLLCHISFYISDACPLVLYFASVIARIYILAIPKQQKERRSGGNPTTTGEMMREPPTMREFSSGSPRPRDKPSVQDFLPRYSSRGRETSPHVFPGYGQNSGGAGKTDPDTKLEQMEAFRRPLRRRKAATLAPFQSRCVWRMDGDVFMRALKTRRAVAAEAEGTRGSARYTG